ncbi:MAG TPA: ribosome biogenesis GTPase Der [Acidimicrobiia bacterium]|jgi:GTP-binding protein|nr:ribosome biogenesis GTPase Der [Acidimicrobiia bacterium]
MTEHLPMVAVVGRPNVGKSTLVNRIVGRRAAIVEENPGVTRDRKELRAEWNGRAFRIVDTGGWLTEGEAGLTGEEPALARKVSAQASAAMKEADVVVLVVDVTTGVTEEDARVAQLLKRADRRVLLVVNKVDDERRESDVWEFAGLGLGEPIPISAIHGRLSGELLDAIVEGLPPAPDDEEKPDDAIFSIAIAGRPNVGKSTLFNRLVGEDRSVVHDLPGTTRDAIDTVIETEDGPLRFVDTAGLRRKSHIDEPTEYASLVRALEAIDRADAALLLIDASEGVTHQDQHLAERIDAAGSAVVIVLNKWDLLDAEQRAAVRAQVADKLGFLSYAPALPVSALTGRRVHQLLPALRDAEGAYHQRIPTAALNRVLRDAQAAHPPPVVKRHRPRILYGTQGATDPPTFTLFTTRPLSPQYLRYLERKLRESFDLGPTPIKLRVRRRSD